MVFSVIQACYVRSMVFSVFLNWLGNVIRLPCPPFSASVASYLVMLVLLDRPGLVVNHPHKAAVVLVSLEQLVGIKGPVL